MWLEVADGSPTTALLANAYRAINHLAEARAIASRGSGALPDDLYDDCMEYDDGELVDAALGILRARGLEGAYDTAAWNEVYDISGMVEGGGVWVNLDAPADLPIRVWADVSQGFPYGASSTVPAATVVHMIAAAG